MGSSIKEVLVQRSRYAEAQLSENEVAANGAAILIGGSGSTGTTLSFLMHYIINDEDLQRRLRDEAVELLHRDGRLDYNTLTGLPLLEAVVREVLRLHPPLPQFVSRESLAE